MAWYWAAWLLLGFGIPEGYALASKRPRNTLSDTVWHWFDVTPGPTPVYARLGTYILAAFLVWLLGHLAFGLWRRW